jgi:hypothetical protein
VASRLQNRRDKSKEQIADDGSPRKKPKLLSIHKQESNQECMDSSIKKGMVDKWIGIPKFTSIKLFPHLQDHIQVTKDVQNIRFRVVNNEGTGNCFYESILASNVFRKKFPKFKDNHHMLRVELQNHAVRNPGLAREFYQLYATPEEKIEEAINFLTENLENDMLENGKWLFQKMAWEDRYKTFREHYNVVDDSPSSVCSALLGLWRDNVNVPQEVINNWVTKEDTDEMANVWWMQGLATDGVWAGNAEMMLFSFAFKLQIIVLTNRESGTEITSSNSLIKILNSPSISRSPGRTQLMNTIFLWALDPDCARVPLKSDENTHHYVSLQQLRPDEKWDIEDCMEFYIVD